MPPGRRSSSSRSSRSRSFGGRSRSSFSGRRSHSSHSSSSYGGSLFGGSSYGGSSYGSSSYSGSYRPLSSSYRPRVNQPLRVPLRINVNKITLRCKKHDYVFYNESWTDEKTGTYYQKGYYDENGQYYNGNEVAFKRPDGSYEAHYFCEYCGTEYETTWKEGFYPTCKNCGAEMSKTPVFIDDILDLDNMDAGNDSSDSYSYGSGDGYDSDDGLNEIFSGLKGFFIQIAIYAGVAFLFWIQTLPDKSDSASSADANRYNYTSYQNEHSDYANQVYEMYQNYLDGQTETNLKIYGTEIYLDEIDDNIYRICEKTEIYEKKLTWDYGTDTYYDYDSNCYLWYNTDVVPNLWQYWYEDIAGSSYYGWMECEGDTWWIETSETNWEQYTGDTSELWHIKNEFDE